MVGWLATGSVLAAGWLAFGSPGDAVAQRLDPRRPSAFAVGSPRGPSPTARVDARRTGLTREELPTGLLRIAWRKTLGISVDQPALVGPDGIIAVVTARGDVVFLDDAGEEVARASAGTGSAGPATMTSDGTVVFTTGAGDVVGLRRSSARPRFSMRVGTERSRAAPLSLDDGGFVVAAGSDLVVLDAEGNVRFRTTLPEAAVGSLLASGEKVVAVTPSGSVYAWVPGREPVRVGSFGAPVDGGATLADATTLVAVIDGSHLAELDLTRGARTTRSIAQGLYLGPPAVRGGRGGAFLTLLAMTTTRGSVVTVDPGGQETLRASIAVLTPPILPDGGAAPLVAPAHTPVLVDARGAIAFAATDGHVGMVTAEGAVDTIGELVCTKTPRSSGIAGLTPTGRGSFAVACEGGALVRIAGENAVLRPSSARAIPPGPAPLRPPAAPAPPPPGDDDDDETP